MNRFGIVAIREVLHFEELGSVCVLCQCKVLESALRIRGFESS